MTAQIEKGLQHLRNFTARKATPIALRVKIDNQDKSFLIDPATGKVSTPPAAYEWANGFDYKKLKRFFVLKNYKVEEVMGEIAPVLV